MSRSLVLIGTWFGPWPAWIDFFLLSCRANADVDWLLVSDQTAPDSTPANVTVSTTSFEAYKARLQSRLAIRLSGGLHPYKMCDFKPALGHVHAGEISRYDYFGFTDLDVIYGKLRSIYNDDLLSRYDAVSSHAEHVSGHLFLMRNTAEMRCAFMSIPGWRERLEEIIYTGFDEQDFSKHLKQGRTKRRWLPGPRRRPCLFRESYSTPAPTRNDMHWFWRDGMLTNEHYPTRPFLYLHLMAWQSNKWYAYMPNVAPGTAAPWQSRDDLVRIDWRTARTEGFMISAAGIEPVQVRPYP